MGFSAKASLVVGISMAKLFKDIKEVSDTYDEHDKFGRKTGKKFTDDKLIAILPNNNEVIISEEKTNYGWNYDFYNSIGFEGDTYVGDIFNVTMGIHYSNYDNKDLHQMIMGLEVCETDNTDIGNTLVSKVEEDVTNAAIDRVRKQLAEVFGYTGGIYLYLINKISY